ncbi:MAG: hypothetical protein LPK02_06960 [Rhodobacterales bacterium]|nr:hypothetical protein [Rhodobacterales bacterium]
MRAVNMDTAPLTRKQVHILELILKGAEDGGHLDMDQMLERMQYETSKQSLQCSIRHLEARNLVRRDYEIRRGRKRAVLCITGYGLQRFDTGTGEFDIILEGFDEDDEGDLRGDTTEK